MATVTRKDIRRMVFLTYPYVDRGQLSRLVAQYAGDRAPLDIDQVQSLAATNPAFLAWYAALAKEATQGRPWQEAKEAGQLDFADGKGWEHAENVIDSIGTNGASIIDSIFSWKSAPYEAQASIAAAQGQTAYAASQAATTRYLVIGAVVVAAIVAAVVLLNKKK